MKTSELVGDDLDTWVAKSIGGYKEDDMWVFVEHGYATRVKIDDWEPSAYWDQGGPILESQRISIQAQPEGWTAQRYGAASAAQGFARGETPLIAGMRAVVAGRFGADLPDEDLP